MNKNFKIIQISGISGLLLFGFIIMGLICGFILFPIWMLMTGWNALIAEVFKGPSINYIQASLLWSFLTLAMYLGLKNSISIKVQKHENMSDINIKELMKRSEDEKSDNS